MYNTILSKCEWNKCVCVFMHVYIYIYIYLCAPFSFEAYVLLLLLLHAQHTLCICSRLVECFCLLFSGRSCVYCNSRVAVASSNHLALDLCCCCCFFHLFRYTLLLFYCCCCCLIPRWPVEVVVYMHVAVLFYFSLSLMFFFLLLALLAFYCLINSLLISSMCKPRPNNKQYFNIILPV